MPPKSAMYKAKWPPYGTDLPPSPTLAGAPSLMTQDALVSRDELRKGNPNINCPSRTSNIVRNADIPSIHLTANWESERRTCFIYEGVGGIKDTLNPVGFRVALCSTVGLGTRTGLCPPPDPPPRDGSSPWSCVSTIYQNPYGLDLP